VTVSPIDGGQITIPERSFVFPNDPKATTTVPSMSFLVTHLNSSSGQPTRLLFDLGLRSHLEAYISKQQVHIQNNRVPYRLGPGVAQSLRDGGLDPSNIDKVILSHVH
jgi:3-hydroxyisobutyrate dehydrogenase